MAVDVNFIVSCDTVFTPNVSVPAGQIRSAGRQHTFRVDTQSRSLKDLSRIPITTPTGKQIRVGDVATINEATPTLSIS